MKISTSYATAIVLGFASLSLCAVTAACGDDDAPGATSTSSSSSSGGGDGRGSTTSSSSSSGGDPAKDAAKAGCEKQKTCAPNNFAAQYASVDACVTDTTSGTPTTTTTAPVYPGVDPACATKTATAACGEFPAECSKGTLAAEGACDGPNQCLSGICTKAAAATCGKCAAVLKENDPCPADFNCGAGLRCDGTKCVKPLADGTACATPAEAAACDLFGGSTCLSDTKVCGKKRQIDGKCAPGASGTPSQDCRFGLTCKDEKCQDVAATYKDLDATCAVGDICKKSFCTGGTCKAYLAENAACAVDLSTGFCDPTAGLTCKELKCVKAPAIEVCK